MGYEVLGGRTPGRRGDALDVPPAGDVEVTDLSDPTSAPGTDCRSVRPRRATAAPQASPTSLRAEVGRPSSR